jgi:cell division protein FtsL
VGVDNKMKKTSLNHVLSFTIVAALFTSGIGIFETANAQSVSERLQKVSDKVSEKSQKAADKLKEVAKKIGGSGGGGGGNNGGCGELCG